MDTTTAKPFPILRSLLDLPTTTSGCAPMDRKLSETFIRADLAEHEGGPLAAPVDWAHPGTGALAQMKEDFGFKVLCKRLEVCSPGTQVSAAAVLLIMGRCTSPGEVVMWAYTLHRLHRKLGRLVTVGELANVFPLGFPTRVGYDEIWDAQKGRALGLERVDNAIDQQEAWQ